MWACVGVCVCAHVGMWACGCHSATESKARGGVCERKRGYVCMCGDVVGRCETVVCVCGGGCFVLASVRPVSWLRLFQCNNCKDVDLGLGLALALGDVPSQLLL